MRKKNFKEIANFNNKQIHMLGTFIQDLENQLWDGHPNIYPNLRIFLEEWCDLIIKEGIKLRIRMDHNGKSRKEIHQYFDYLVEHNKVIEELYGNELVAEYSAWSFSLKIRTIECVFKEKGLDVNRWLLSNHTSNRNNHNNLKDQLNNRAHISTQISDDREKACAQFEARFGILQILHDGFYKDIMESVFNIDINPYVMPDKSDILEIVNRYYNEIK